MLEHPDDDAVLAKKWLAVKIRVGRTTSRKGSSMLNVMRVPSEIGWYLAGFTDGEGSFNVSFRPRGDYSSPWKVSLCFNVSQRDPVVLALMKRHLECGTMRQRQDGVWYYEVNSLRPLAENVVPFFERFHFLSAKKKRDFAKFKQLVTLFGEGRHLDHAGIREILEIRADMNDGGKRRYTDEAILAAYGMTRESSETARQTPTPEMIQSELHGDMQSSTETIEPVGNDE
jgi:hypothetical protein